MPRTSMVALAGALFALAGCGGSSNTSSSPSTPAASATTTTTSSPTPSGGGKNLSLEANPQGNLEYNTKSVTAKAGKVTINFTNSSPIAHNVTIESASGQTVGATPTFQGGSKTLGVDLKPGVYKFYCSVPGHRQAGMEGTITVQ